MLASRPSHFRLLELPPELLPIVLSFVFPGAVSNRQLSPVIQYAADRTALFVEPEGLEQYAADRRTRAQRRLERETHPNRYYQDLGPLRETLEFLERTGCYATTDECGQGFEQRCCTLTLNHERKTQLLGTISLLFWLITFLVRFFFAR